MDAFAADVGLQPGAEPDQGLLAAAEDALRHRSELAAEEQQKLNMRAQQALLDLGYDIGDVDGAIGARSRSALRAWSSIRGRPVTEVDEQVVASLEQAVVEQLAAPQADSPAEPAGTPTAAAPSQTAPTSSQAPPIVVDELEADVPAVPPVEAPSRPRWRASGSRRRRPRRSSPRRARRDALGRRLRHHRAGHRRRRKSEWPW